jgi:UDP-galactopyranose mutase
VLWQCDVTQPIGIEPAVTVLDCDQPIDGSQLSFQPDLCIFRSQGAMESTTSANGAKIVYIPDGVDLRNFVRANRPQTEAPPDSRFIRKPVMAYFGTIDQRIDIELVTAVAEETLHWNVIMVGPVKDLVPETLPRRENLFWLGPRSYHDLGLYAKSVDMFLLPYRQTGASFIPKQMREFLVTGRPVLTTRSVEIQREFGDLLFYANSHREFIDSCHAKLVKVLPEHRVEIIHQTAKRTWHQVVREVEAQIGAG